MVKCIGIKESDEGSIPSVMARQGEGQLFCPSESTLLVRTCLCLIPRTSCVRHSPIFVRMLKMLYPSVVKPIVGLTAGGMVTHKNTACTTLVINQGWQRDSLAVGFPRGERPEFAMAKNVQLRQHSFF